jgi:hypothetical protein
VTYLRKTDVSEGQELILPQKVPVTILPSIPPLALFFQLHHVNSCVAIQFSLQLNFLPNKSIFRKIIILLPPPAQMFLLLPIFLRYLVIKVISITPHDISTFLSFSYNLSHQFLLFFVGTIFEPLDLGAPSFLCEHCGAILLV